MRILVFGASGATGKLVVQQALAANHDVTAFVRDPAKLTVTHANLRIVQGDVGDAARVNGAVANQDAVISTLGVATPLKHDPVVVRGVRNVITSMQQQGVRRFIYLSFIGVEESRSAAGFVLRHIAQLPLRREIADHESKEALVKESTLDWTIVRAPKLTNAARTGKFRSGVDIVATSMLPTLPRADVADFLVSQASDATFVKKAARLLP